jgi:hypothetical protein
MLAQAVEIEAELVGEFDLFKQVSEALGRRLQAAPVQRVRSVLSEGIEADLHSNGPVVAG